MRIDQVLNHPKKIAVLAGRFSPIHAGHYNAYKMLVNMFGTRNTFLASSNKTNNDSSPFTFANKKLIATEMFNIPENKFIQTKIPYQPIEILKDYDPDKDILILALGEKDKDRLSSSTYFELYPEDDSDLQPFGKKGYIKIVPIQAKGISASKIRSYFKTEKDVDKKKEIFAKIYGKFNETVFALINSILS